MPIFGCIADNVLIGSSPPPSTPITRCVFLALRHKYAFPSSDVQGSQKGSTKVQPYTSQPFSVFTGQVLGRTVLDNTAASANPSMRACFVGKVMKRNGGRSRTRTADLLLVRQEKSLWSRCLKNQQ